MTASDFGLLFENACTSGALVFAVDSLYERSVLDLYPAHADIWFVEMALVNSVLVSLLFILSGTTVSWFIWLKVY